MNMIRSYFKIALALSIGFVAMACQEDTLAPTRGLLYPAANITTITVGETVSFADYSTRVLGRQWTFAGGQPASSTENALQVTYTEPGTYAATLEVTYMDGTTETESLQITVNDVYVPLVTVEGPTYVFYSEDPELTQDHPKFSLSRSGVALSRFVSSAFEGSEAINLSIDPAVTNTFAMLQTQNVGNVDLRAFRNGYLNLAIRSESQNPILVRIEGGGANSYAYVGPGDYGFERDGSWKFISIPMEDVLSQINVEDGKMALLGNFNQFRLRSQTGQFNPATFDFSVDLIFFSNAIPTIRQ